MDQVISFSNKTQGRDKFCKVVQYASRFLKHQTANNKDSQAKWNGLMVGMRDARKLFRLFQTLNEIQTIIERKNSSSPDQVEKALQIISRIGFGGYWLFDNIVVLCNIKFLTKDAQPLNVKGSRCWFLGLLASLISAIRLYVLSFKREQSLLRKIANNENRLANEGEIKDLKQKRVTYILNIIKCLGDMITAGQDMNTIFLQIGFELWKKLIKKDANDGWCGIGGLISALIASYQLY